MCASIAACESERGSSPAAIASAGSASTSRRLGLSAIAIAIRTPRRRTSTSSGSERKLWWMRGLACGSGERSRTRPRLFGRVT